MVAITVILAAVIGAFVLEIGDQQETAPNTSFDSEQSTIFIADAPSGSTGCAESSGRKHCLNLTMVQINHAGGETLDIAQIDASYGGNTSVWGLTDPSNAGTKGENPDVNPTPDTRQTLGTNEPAHVTSGESMNAIFRGGSFDGSSWKSNPPSDENVENMQYYFDITKDRPGWDDVWIQLHEQTGPAAGHIPEPALLANGDNVNVVWTAESGGKTQTLFKYTVQ
jgi:hypothetical protein